MCIYMCGYTQAGIRETHISIYIYVHVKISIYIYIYIHTYTCTYIQKLCIYVYIYIKIYAHIYVYTNMQIIFFLAIFWEGKMWVISNHKIADQTRTADLG